MNEVMSKYAKIVRIIDNIFIWLFTLLGIGLVAAEVYAVKSGSASLAPDIFARVVFVAIGLVIIASICYLVCNVLFTKELNKSE